MRTIYLAQANSDMAEGRGPMTTVAAFEHEADAKRATVGLGVQGVGDGAIQPLSVYSSFEEYNQSLNLQLREQALAKLSMAERIALGL